MVTLFEVQAACARIRDHVRETPLIAADLNSFPPAGRVWLKLEQLQHTGSFKVRGAFNRILLAMTNGTLTPDGVVAASGGNAGLGVAYAASKFGVPARVYVPTTAPAVKVNRLRQLGAEVVLIGSKYHDAYVAAQQHVNESKALFCHAYDQPEVCAGQGTLGIEILHQAQGEIDTIMVSVGGGGLMAGIAAATEGEAQVIGVEPVGIPTFHEAQAAGAPVNVPVSSIAADSLGASRLGDIAHAVATRTGVKSVLVDDGDILAARKLLWDHRRVIVEHGAALSLAALMTGAYEPYPGERIAVVLSGANTDPATL